MHRPFSDVGCKCEWAHWVHKWKMFICNIALGLDCKRKFSFFNLFFHLLKISVISVLINRLISQITQTLIMSFGVFLTIKHFRFILQEGLRCYSAPLWRFAFLSFYSCYFLCAFILYFQALTCVASLYSCLLSPYTASYVALILRYPYLSKQNGLRKEDVLCCSVCGRSTV